MLTVILVKIANVLLANMIYNCYGTDIVNIMQVYQPPSLVICCTRRLTYLWAISTVSYPTDHLETADRKDRFA
jgi:hypothetical protein